MKLNYGKRVVKFAMRPISLDAPITILEGSVRSGKTWSLIPKIIMSCASPVTGWKFIIGQSKETVYTNILADLFSIVGKKNYSYNSNTGLLRIFSSQFRVMGAKDEGSERYLRGSTIGFAIADEVTLMPEAFWNMLISRMSPEGARLYGTTNCDVPMHWLKKKIDDPNLRDTGKMETIHYTMEDNPNLTEDYKSMTRAMYRGLFYERYILGLWVMAEGSIYRDAWSDELWYDDSTTPQGLYGKGGYVDHWISVDVGVDHPQVYIEFYDDGQTIWVSRAWCWDSKEQQRQLTDAQYADELQRFMGPNACQIIIPPEAASFQTELAMRGMWVTDADNEVIEGIQTFSSIMAAKKIRFHKTGTLQLVDKLQRYVWDAKAAKRGIEKPLKVDDDWADAARYGVHGKIPRWRFLGG